MHRLVGLQRMGQFVGINLLTNFAAIALGMAISAMVPNADVANAAGPPFLIIGKSACSCEVDNCGCICLWRGV